MARYIPGINGPLVGSVGSNTYSKNRYGYYVKTKAQPTNPNTPLQATTRQAMRKYVQLWQTTITATQAEAWDEAALQHKRSKYGAGFSLSGVNLYVAVNTLLEKFGESAITEPTIFTGAVGSTLPAITSVALSGKLEISAWSEVDSNIRCAVYATNATGQTISYKKSPFVFSYAIKSSTVFPVLIDVAYPGSNDDKYRVFFGFKFFDVRGAVNALLQSNYDGTRVVAP